MPKIPIIEVKDLSVEYDGRVILENIDFSVGRGEIFVIVGGSGCGKSTLLRQMIGLEVPTKGAVYIDGENFSYARAKQKNEIRKRFGVLFQSGGLLASMTLAENILLALEKFNEISESRISEIINLKLAMVGLGGTDSFLPSEISGGMKKRAALARAMALDPAILFFDEPSSGLDPVTAASLDNLIIELNQSLGTTMVVVTHDLSSILTIAHRIIMLDTASKSIIASGTPDELKNMKENTKVFNFFNRIAEF